jgi:hypothetical protein
MRKTYIYILIICASLGCKEAEIAPRDFPYIDMSSVIVTPEGVEFTGEVQILGSSEVSAYGFVWGENPNPELDQGFKVAIDNPITLGYFSLKVESALVKDVTYYVRPFAQLGEITFFGTEKSFVSEGSKAPVILDFEPRSGKPFSQVLISGKNLGFSKYNKTVKFDNLLASIDSATDDKIYVKVPFPSLPFSGIPDNPRIQVSLGHTNAESNNSFDYIFPFRFDGISHGFGIRATSINFPNRSLIINPNSLTGVIFNPADGSMTNIDLPVASGTYPLGFTVHDFPNKGYALFQNTFWEYDLILNVWTKRTDFPDSRIRFQAFSMGLDKTGIVGLYVQSNHVWAYDPLLDAWSRKADSPIVVSSTFGHFTFSVENLGYLGLAGQNSFWRYDPNENNWQQLTPFENNLGFYIANMVIDGTPFLGYAFNDKSQLFRIMKYDINSDKWRIYASMPVEEMYSYVSFSIDGLGYMFNTFEANFTTKREIVIFDPSKN